MGYASNRWNRHQARTISSNHLLYYFNVSYSYYVNLTNIILIKIIGVNKHYFHMSSYIFYKSPYFYVEKSILLSLKLTCERPSLSKEVVSYTWIFHLSIKPWYWNDETNEMKFHTLKGPNRNFGGNIHEKWQWMGMLA